MIVLFVILLGLFLTFTAFALDVGNMYLWKLRIDKTARAAAMAGLGYRGLQGWTVTGTPAGRNDLQAVINTSVAENFRTYGITTTPASPATYIPRDDTISVTITHNVNTLLVGRLSNIFGFSFGGSAGHEDEDEDEDEDEGSPKQINITSTHRAQLNPAYIALILDVSGSMLCPAAETLLPTQASCQCRKNNTCVAANDKLTKMIAGVNTFTNAFNPNRDYISIIPFNLAAWTTFSMINNGGNRRTFGADLANFNKAISENDPIVGLRKLANSNTNHCDALAQAIGEFKKLATDLGLADDARRAIQPFVVFFTDGAPNAFRGVFNNADLNQAAFLPAGALGTISTELYHSPVEWSDGALKQYRGPGSFVVRKEDATTKKPNTFGLDVGVLPSGATSCGTAQSDPTKFRETISGCLSSTTSTFRFAIPNTDLNAAVVNSVPFETTTQANDPNWPTATVTANWQNYDQLPYYCAIEAADYIRTTYGGTIYTIGLGPGSQANPTGSSCNDPLQDADDHLSRKDLFLARLAMAGRIFDSSNSVSTEYAIAGSASRTTSNCAYHRYKQASAPTLTVGYMGKNGADGSDTWKTLRPQKPTDIDPNQRKVDTQGEYYPTKDAAQLQALFGLVAKSILLKLSS